MKRNNVFGVWHRCRSCGSIFPERAELQAHLASHGVRTNEPAPRELEDDFLLDDRQDANTYSTIYQPTFKRNRQR
jgi:hypothetical protein